MPSHKVFFWKILWKKKDLEEQNRARLTSLLLHTEQITRNWSSTTSQQLRLKNIDDIFLTNRRPFPFSWMSKRELKRRLCTEPICHCIIIDDRSHKKIIFQISWTPRRPLKTRTFKSIYSYIDTQMIICVFYLNNFVLFCCHFFQSREKS